MTADQEPEGMPSISVVCGVLHRHNLFLAACRPEGTPHAGLWELPGGKIEPGESPQAALLREFSEELGVGVYNFTLWKTLTHNYQSPPRHVTLHVFMVNDFSGEPVPVEGQTLRWISPKDAQTLPFLEADTTLLQELGEIFDAQAQKPLNTPA